MPDISGLVDLLNARILLSHAGELLRTEPVLGRSMKTMASSDASILVSSDGKCTYFRRSHSLLLNGSNSISKKHKKLD